MLNLSVIRRKRLKNMIMRRKVILPYQEVCLLHFVQSSLQKSCSCLLADHWLSHSQGTFLGISHISSMDLQTSDPEYLKGIPISNHRFHFQFPGINFI